MEDILVLKEYTDVFPEEISGLPSKRELDFTIELVPGAVPHLKGPSSNEHTGTEWTKSQLKELIDKKYIQPSVSPWGAHVIFVKKKDGTTTLHRLPSVE